MIRVAGHLGLLLFFFLISSFSAFASQADYWIWDFKIMPPTFRKPIFSKVMTGESAEGDRLHLWVEDKIEPNTPSSGTLNSLLNLLVYQPGVLSVEKRLFGSTAVPPSGDRDVHVLIAAVKPYENHGKKFGFDGFFNVFDQMTEEEANKYDQHSNEKNIIYINALNDVASEYMQAVVVHELSHLLIHANDDGSIDPWLNELLAEASMQILQFYTDTEHVNKYRQNSEWPLAVKGMGISYGATSLFGEYLMRSFPPEKIGDLVKARGIAFGRVEEVYGSSWASLWADYVVWLFEQKPLSGFSGAEVSVKENASTHTIAATGVKYLSALVVDDQFRIVSVPHDCVKSANIVRTKTVSRARAEQIEQATALWVESVPPCAAQRGESAYGKDAFVLKYVN